MSESASWTAASEVSTIVPNEEEGWGDDVNWLAININGATSFAGSPAADYPKQPRYCCRSGSGLSARYRRSARSLTWNWPVYPAPSQHSRDLVARM